MRGKALAYAAALALAGITPAYAGKSSTATLAAHSTGDHPRVCGEKHAVPVSLMWSAGSPPRVRGKDGDLRLPVLAVGITPAYAGKSKSRKCTQAEREDHPRVCGEKARTLIVQDEPQGSPPRVRGKADNSSHCQIAHRITPACAGKSCRLRQLHGAYRDHPRVCGEKLPAAA